MDGLSGFKYMRRYSVYTPDFGDDTFQLPEFRTSLQVEAVGRKNWKLLSPLLYVTYVRGYPQLITMEQGFVSDLSSIPWWARVVLPVNDYHRWAGVTHDWLYHNQNLHDFSRLEVDCIFEECMEVFDDLEQWKITAMYNAVRIGAGSNWENNPSHFVRI